LNRIPNEATGALSALTKNGGSTMNSEHDNDAANSTETPGVLETALDAEIDAGLSRLGVSREELHAEANIYLWVGEWPEVYEPFPLSVAFRARAVELLDCLIGDGLGTEIQQVDEYIAELREVLPGAAGKPSPALAHQFKEAKQKGDEEEKAACRR
jgi:hypothetical protein